MICRLVETFDFFCILNSSFPRFSALTHCNSLIFFLGGRKCMTIFRSSLWRISLESWAVQLCTINKADNYLGKHRGIGDLPISANRSLLDSSEFAQGMKVKRVLLILCQSAFASKSTSKAMQRDFQGTICIVNLL